jgi:hypothetical protein
VEKRLVQAFWLFINAESYNAQEICYLPTWPFFRGGTGGPLRFHWPLGGSGPGGIDDSARPQPRCIQRIE